MSVTGGSGPGQTITISGVTWPMLLTVIGAIFIGAGSIIAVLVGVVYGGLQDKIDSRAKEANDSIEALTKRVQGLDDTFRTAVAAGVSVQDLLARAPRLEATINETHDAVLTLRTQFSTFQEVQSLHTRQLQEIQRGVTVLPRPGPR